MAYSRKVFSQLSFQSPDRGSAIGCHKRWRSSHLRLAYWCPVHARCSPFRAQKQSHSHCGAEHANHGEREATNSARVSATGYNTTGTLASSTRPFQSTCRVVAVSFTPQQKWAGGFYEANTTQVLPVHFRASAYSVFPVLGCFVVFGADAITRSCRLLRKLMIPKRLQQRDIRPTAASAVPSSVTSISSPGMTSSGW